MDWTQVSYLYDGTFDGFLTCVYEAYVNREEPMDFYTFDTPQASFYPERAVYTDEAHAKRVFISFAKKFGNEGQNMVSRGFLTCMQDKELWLWRFIRLGYDRGPMVCKDLADPIVDRVGKALKHLGGEAHLLTGFVRFSQLDGALVGEITPKNRVLTMLRPHFCGRYPQEKFLLYDRTYKEALVHIPGHWAIVPMEEFEMGQAGAEELAYRRMWRSFYDTISIEGRYNPKCRQTHMPKRYWANMTEFQTEQQTALQK